MEFGEKTLELLAKLKSKHDEVGEDLNAHLEGMLYSYYLNYWDYIGIDALLNLQKPKTKYPDEMIFIVYHQITELYFKIILHELEQIGFKEHLTASFMLEKLNRINNYFEHLTGTFDVLFKGLDHQQFLKFRTALVPSSGFQSIQYRLIELWSTKFVNLVNSKDREHVNGKMKIKELYPYLYWKRGATDSDTGEKKLTLTQFEEKYGNLIIRKGKELRKRNLWYKYNKLEKSEKQNQELINALKEFDTHANINWPLAHYGFAIKYLHNGKEYEKSTGGTNWKQYLPPRFQQQVFYPEIWTSEEMDNWGRAWVESEFSKGK